jgi:glycosyltransferase involved in cell wall biosynthesis
MTVVAHIGPPLRTGGGPAGYLRQLAAAFEGRGAGTSVLFPAPAAAAPIGAQASPSPLRLMAHRVRLALLGKPRYYRPHPEAIRREGGALAAMCASSLGRMRDENQASLSQARARGADVLFAHDLAGAEAALATRSGENVWLMLHAPMPFGLYVAWSWGIPELDWREILALPDVRALVNREIDACQRVDRLILPCPEAFDELVRCDARFESLRSRVSYVITGARRGGGGPVVTQGEARARFGLPLDQPIGLFLGNSEPYRGLDRLLEGLDAVGDPRVVPGCVAIAGPDRRSLPASRRIRALGRVSDVSTLLTAVDFVVNVNRFSLFDLSLIEALEAGRPLLMHATGGNRAFQRLGAGCDMLPDLETQSIADGLERMFSLPAAARNALVARSRACYDAHLTLDAFRLAHERVYAMTPSTAAVP